MRKLEAIHVLHWQWVKGHDGILGNERADHNADMGASLGVFTLGLTGANMEGLQQPHQFGGREPLTWERECEMMRSAAETTLGKRQKSQSTGAPISASNMFKVDHLRSEVAKAWEGVRRVQRTKEEAEARRIHRSTVNALTNFKREARKRFIAQVIDELNGALDSHDMGTFYKLLPKLGIHLYGKTPQGRSEHTLDTIADYLEDRGKDHMELKESTGERGLDPIEEDATLNEVPTYSEIRYEIANMHDSAADSDEVTMGMIK